MAQLPDLRSWLQEQCNHFRFEVGGVFQRESDLAWWPLEAVGPVELEERLAQGGHLLPLPGEPAALANVLEVSVVNFLALQVLEVDGARIQRGTERGYPDFEVAGPAFGGGFHAVDVKAARRAPNGQRTQSRITLYTGDTYFRWPSLHWPGTFRPFSDYASHLDVIVIYTLNPDCNERVENLEIIVQEPWRIASRELSSATQYIGAIDDIAGLRAGAGAFGTPEEFYDYWRKFPFKISTQVQRQLQQLLTATQDELARVRARQDDPG